MTKIYLRNLSLIIPFITAIVCGSAANAGTLENMERERAILIETYLSFDLNEKQRTQRLTISKKRLTDLERLVLRDKSLLGSNRGMVRSAFNNYDLSFLLHASLEKNRTVFEHWLQEIGVSSSSLMKARLGRR